MRNCWLFKLPILLLPQFLRLHLCVILHILKPTHYVSWKSSMRFLLLFKHLFCKRNIKLMQRNMCPSVDTPIFQLGFSIRVQMLLLQYSTFRLQVKFIMCKHLPVCEFNCNECNFRLSVRDSFWHNELSLLVVFEYNLLYLFECLWRFSNWDDLLLKCASSGPLGWQRCLLKFVLIKPLHPERNCKPV